MISTIFVVAFSAVIFEVAIATKWKWYRMAAGSNVLVNFAGSMALSYIISAAWDMTGLIAGTAAMMSTFMTVPYYKLSAWYETQDWDVSEKWAEFQTNWGELLKDFIRVLEITIRGLTLPLRAYRRVHIGVKRVVYTVKEVRAS